MAQIQQDLRGDRCSYYADYSQFDGVDRRGFLVSGFRKGLVRYVKQTGMYLLGLDGGRAHTMDPIPIFKDAVNSIVAATEEALGYEQNFTKPWAPSKANHKYIAGIVTPWELNHIFANALALVLEDNGLNSPRASISTGAFRMVASPSTPWWDHATDEIDYTGETGVAMAFEQARALVEIHSYIGVRYNPDLWPEEESVGKSLVEIRPQPPTYQHSFEMCPWLPDTLDLPCINWAKCWKSFIFADGHGYGQWHDENYWRWYFGLFF